MMPHVTLVDSPCPSGAHQHPPFTPLGLGYLAAVLEKNHYEVDVLVSICQTGCLHLFLCLNIN